MERNGYSILKRLSVVVVWLMTVATIAAAPPSSSGQEWKYKGQVVGGGGYGAFFHGEHKQFDGGTLFGGVAVRPFRGALSGLGFSGRYTRLVSNDELIDDVSIFSATVEYHFGNGRFQPFVLGGIGAVSSERTVVISYGDEFGIYDESRYREDIQKVGLELGAGVKAAIGDRWFVQPEFRYVDTTPGSGFNLGIPLIQVGVGYSW